MSFLLLAAVAAAPAKSLQLCLTLCNPRDASPPGSPVPGILQARTLEWVMKEAAAAAAKSLQSWPTLCDPIDGSPPGSPSWCLLNTLHVLTVRSFSLFGKEMLAFLIK